MEHESPISWYKNCRKMCLSLFDIQRYGSYTGAVFFCHLLLGADFGPGCAYHFLLVAEELLVEVFDELVVFQQFRQGEGGAMVFGGGLDLTALLVRLPETAISSAPHCGGVTINTGSPRPWA